MAIDPRSWLLVVSLGVHGAIAAAVGAVKAPVRRDPVVVTIRAARSRPAPPPPPRATPSPAPSSVPQPVAPSRAPSPHRSARAAQPSAARPSAPAQSTSAAPSAGTGAPDFGLTMGNGGSMAVQQGGGGGGGEARPTSARAAVAQPSSSDGCDEETQRARPLEIAQPEYPEEAREAAIEGRVRVEVTIDERGQVVGARVLQSLGHGCDEAALTVARAARFEAATRCGRAVRSTLTIGIRFTL